MNAAMWKTPGLTKRVDHFEGAGHVPQDGNQFNLDIQNAGDSTISGIELEVQYAPTDQTSLYAAFGYAQTDFDTSCRTGDVELDFRPACEVNGVIGEDLSDGDFAASLDVTLSVGGR